ncbi:MAG: hypothetical protein H0U38_04515 [Chloroflexia bacterium]|nr:hypothetical protein [Chloroflexia bacterium]
MNRQRTVLWSSMLIALIAAVSASPANAAQDLCVHVDGVPIFQSGSATCESIEGTTAVAVGDASYASVEEDADNTAIAIGDGSVAESGDVGAGNSLIAVGNDSIASNSVGNDNDIIAVGNGSEAFNADEGDSNALTVIGDGSVFSIQGESGCMVIVINGQEFGGC